MKLITQQARALSDRELAEARLRLQREIPLAQSMLDAYQREHRRRARLAREVRMRAQGRLL